MWPLERAQEAGPGGIWADHEAPCPWPCAGKKPPLRALWGKVQFNDHSLKPFWEGSQVGKRSFLHSQ